MSEKKNIRIYETLDSATRLNKEHTSGGLRLSGVFGKCGIRNMNNRVYERNNYGKMVRLLQEEIEKNNGVMGELEHPNSMNINLNNVSHKIESIQMNEDGTITGSILLLNTDKGRQAQAIIEGGLDLFISSRASGNIDKDGNVMLEALKTYDLVGTPGFSEARMKMCENYQPNEKLYMINENLSYIVEEEEDKVLEQPEADASAEEQEPEAEERRECDDQVLSDILARLDDIENKLEQICSGECDMELVDKAVEECRKWVTNRYTPRVNRWVTEVNNRTLKKQINEALGDKFGEAVENWINEQYTPQINRWIRREVLPAAETRITESLVPSIEKWLNEEYSKRERRYMGDAFGKWVNEEFAEEVNRWVNEELSEEIGKWINKEVVPEIYANVSDYITEKRGASLDTVDSILEMLENPKEEVQAKTGKELNEGFTGNPALVAMPTAYRPLWNTLNESRKADILSRAKVYDFGKAGVAERFWAGVDFSDQPEVVNESRNNSVYSGYQNSVIAGIRRFKRVN